MPVVIYQGDAYIIFARSSLEKIWTNEKVIEMKNWMRDTYSPDEQFWATIAGNFHTLTNSSKISSTAYVRYISAKWESKTDSWQWPNRTCNGQLIRQMCIFGMDDVAQLLEARKEGFLFANKFDDEVDAQVSDELLKRIIT